MATCNPETLAGYVLGVMGRRTRFVIVSTGVAAARTVAELLTVMTSEVSPEAKTTLSGGDSEKGVRRAMQSQVGPASLLNCPLAGDNRSISRIASTAFMLRTSLCLPCCCSHHMRCSVCCCQKKSQS